MKQDIKEAKYEGYLWQSDQNKPEMLYGEKTKCFTLEDGENPFIVEGLLWDAENDISISIRNVDGHYFVATQPVSKEELENSLTLTPIDYLPHRLPGVKKVKFLRRWEKEQDPLCEYMETLQLKANIFVGFEK